MLIEEKTAKDMFCPIAFSKLEIGKVPLSCQGSKCMAWRWPDDHGTAGYCGMAGRPPAAEKIILRSLSELLRAELGLPKKKKTIKVPVEFEVGS
jgi:hypothetical protein